MLLPESEEAVLQELMRLVRIRVAQYKAGKKVYARIEMGRWRVLCNRKDHLTIYEYDSNMLIHRGGSKIIRDRFYNFTSCCQLLNQLRQEMPLDALAAIE